MEIVRDPVIINSGISGQLVDQTIHINGFIVDGLDVFIHLLRRICHTVHDSFHITLNGCDRGLQIMGNIADQLFVLLLMLGVLFRGFLQPQTHVLIIAVEITDLTPGICLQNIIKVAFLDLAHCHIQLIDGLKYALVDPLGQHQAGEDQDHNDSHEHIDQQMSRDQRIDLRDDKYAARCSIPESEINLFYILLQFIVEISAVIRQILFTVGRQFFKNVLCGFFIAGIVKLVTLSYYNISRLPRYLLIDMIQIFFIFQPAAVFLHLVQQHIIRLIRGVGEFPEILRHHGIINIRQAETLRVIHQVNGNHYKSHDRQQ